MGPRLTPNGVEVDTLTVLAVSRGADGVVEDQRQGNGVLHRSSPHSPLSREVAGVPALWLPFDCPLSRKIGNTAIALVCEKFR